MVDKKILDVIDLKIEIASLKEEVEKETDEILENNCYFFMEGGTTYKRDRLYELEEKLDKLLN